MWGNLIKQGLILDKTQEPVPLPGREDVPGPPPMDTPGQGKAL